MRTDSPRQQSVSSVEQNLRLMKHAPLLLEAVEHLLPLAERELLTLEPVGGGYVSVAMQREHEAYLVAVAAGQKALQALEPRRKPESSNLRVMQAAHQGDYL
jgi:hypothetical protein